VVAAPDHSPPHRAVQRFTALAVLGGGMDKYIKLTQDIPVMPEHGMTKGLVLKVQREGFFGRWSPKWFVLSPLTRAEIGIMPHEAVEVPEPQKED
jgi:hypothetical protein